MRPVVFRIVILSFLLLLATSTRGSAQTDGRDILAARTHLIAEDRRRLIKAGNQASALLTEMLDRISENRAGAGDGLSRYALSLDIGRETKPVSPQFSRSLAVRQAESVLNDTIEAFRDGTVTVDAVLAYSIALDRMREISALDGRGNDRAITTMIAPRDYEDRARVALEDMPSDIKDALQRYGGGTRVLMWPYEKMGDLFVTDGDGTSEMRYGTRTPSIAEEFRDLGRVALTPLPKKGERERLRIYRALPGREKGEHRRLRSAIALHRLTAPSCSGVAVGRHHVLTAAHCICPTPPFVTLGNAIRVGNGPDADPHAVRLDVKADNVWRYGALSRGCAAPLLLGDGRHASGDIALVETHDPIEDRMAVVPDAAAAEPHAIVRSLATIGAQRHLKHGITLIGSGFGEREDDPIGGEKYNAYFTADLTCSVGEDALGRCESPLDFITRGGRTPADSCRGDSGAPLYAPVGTDESPRTSSWASSRAGAWRAAAAAASICASPAGTCAPGSRPGSVRRTTWPSPMTVYPCTLPRETPLRSQH